MIRPAEIQQIAYREGVRDTQIEKDYVLTRLLAAIVRNPMLSKNLVFKGGTVLRKFYFADYRYSEDLDFTMIGGIGSKKEIFDAFDSVFDDMRGKTNFRLSLVNFSELKTGNVNFYIAYDGPLGGANKQVKVDISKDEILLFPVEARKMFDSYSDSEECLIKCYSLQPENRDCIWDAFRKIFGIRALFFALDEPQGSPRQSPMCGCSKLLRNPPRANRGFRVQEIMVEKMRPLLSRQQPRDFYDIWYLSKNEGIEMSDYCSEFITKSKHKNLNPDALQGRIEKLLPVFKHQWENSLGKQMQELPLFEDVSREVGRHLRKFFRECFPAG
jgi:predicted nucleotidyltransferase component of viral defense system